MRFKYKTTNIGLDKIPLLDVVISNIDSGEKVGYKALLDTGAFISVFHADIAGLIGIDLSKIKDDVKFGGVGTTTKGMKGRVSIVNLTVVERGRSKNFDSPVLFSKDINPKGEPLLGRQGFIDRFSKVELALSENKFYLYP